MLTNIKRIYQLIVIQIKHIYNWPHNLMDTIFGDHTW